MTKRIVIVVGKIVLGIVLLVFGAVGAIDILIYWNKGKSDSQVRIANMDGFKRVATGMHVDSLFKLMRTASGVHFKDGIYYYHFILPSETGVDTLYIPVKDNLVGSIDRIRQKVKFPKGAGLEVSP